MKSNISNYNKLLKARENENFIDEEMEAKAELRKDYEE